MNIRNLQLGLGIGWRPELALFIERRWRELGFVELVAENVDPKKLPRPVEELRERGVKIIPHAVSLSLGGADPLDMRRVDHLARVAEAVGAPLVSEHIAYVRSGDVEIGHLTPIARTRESLEVLIENVNAARKVLPVPLALENIAALFEWPDAEMDEAEFVRQALEATDSALLLDVSNAYANACNQKTDPLATVERLPLERLAYVHMGGGAEDENGIYHDTHSHRVPDGAIELLERLCARGLTAGVMLERDDHFPGETEMADELDRIAAAVGRGRARKREVVHAV